MSTSSGFSVQVESAENGVSIAHVTGDIDAHTTKLLQAEIGKVYSQKRYNLVLDLTHVNYMSSAGASLFIVALGEAKDNGGELVLMQANPAVRQVLDLLGLSPMFQIVDDKKAALATFLKE